MLMTKVLATKTVPAAEFAALTSPDRQAIIRAVHEDLRERGFTQHDYVLEATIDPESRDVTLEAHEVDQLTRPLEFDNRGII
jgi:hypothetical protein